MTWDGKSVSVSPNANGLTFTLVYEVTDGKQTIPTTEANVSDVNSIDQIINDAVVLRNRVDAQKDAIANLDPSLYADVSLADLKARKAPPPPTQDQLDFEAWTAAKIDYQTKLKVFQSGLSKTVTQQDVDAAYALMKLLYKDEYGAFL